LQRFHHRKYDGYTYNPWKTIAMFWNILTMKDALETRQFCNMCNELWIWKWNWRSKPDTFFYVRKSMEMKETYDGKVPQPFFNTSLSLTKQFWMHSELLEEYVCMMNFEKWKREGNCM
jgi:hypothetical protein